MRIRWSHLSIIAVGLLLWGPATSALSNELWHDNFEEARNKATSDGRLLILVQFDSDFLKPILGSDEVENYEYHCIDKVTRRWLDEKAVLVAEGVGRPDNVALDFGKAAGRPLDNAAIANQPDSIGTCITWFCNPSGIVCGFLQGFPEPAEFWGSAKSIHERQRVLGEAPTSDVSRDWHLQQVPPNDQSLYGNFLSRSKSKDKEVYRRHMISAAADSTARCREKRLSERFVEPRNLQIVKMSGSYENQFSHMVLAEIPDATVSELQRSIWESWAQVRMWHAKQKGLINWVESQRVKKRPVLIRVSNAWEKSTWPSSTRPRLKEMVEQFSIIEDASLDDIAVVANFLKTGKLLVPVNRTATFFAATSLGDEYCFLTTENGDKELEQKLASINALETKRR